MVSVRELHLTERIQSELPQERLLNAYPAYPRSHAGSPRPSKKIRPVIFEGQRMPGDTWRALYANPARIFTSNILDPTSASLADGYNREKAKKRNRSQYGEWTSSAGRLLIAVQPRSRAGVYPTLAIAERHIYIVCIQRQRGTLKKLGKATHVTASLRRQDMSWVRERGDVDYEFGFTDGSWATLSVAFADDLGDFFPNMLGKKDPIPW